MGYGSVGEACRNPTLLSANLNLQRGGGLVFSGVGNMSGGIDRRGGELGAASTVSVIFNRQFGAAAGNDGIIVFIGNPYPQILIVSFQVVRVVRIGCAI